MQQRESTSWGETFEWASLDEFLAADSIPDGVQAIMCRTLDAKPVFIHVLTRTVSGTALFAHFHGARGRRPGDVPSFSAFPTSQLLGCSFALVFDPTLALNSEIGLGWFEGFAGFAAADSIHQVITHLAVVAAAPRTIAWGGSAGGFASLRMAASLPEVTAFVWNPQTSISRYRQSAVQRYARVAFDSEDLVTSMNNQQGMVHDLTALPPGHWSDRRVVYLQESRDDHVSRHLAPLLQANFPDFANESATRDTVIGHVTPSFYLHQSLWGPGHVPPNKDAVLYFLRKLGNTAIPIEDVFRELPHASRELLRSSDGGRDWNLQNQFEPLRPCGRARLIQWGSLLGSEVIKLAADTNWVLSRTITGQSVMSAFAPTRRGAPKTALDLSPDLSAAERKSLLDDRQKSFKAALRATPGPDVVLLDLLEDLRGTVSAGDRLTTTDHGRIKRVDGQPLNHQAFGSPAHRVSWQPRFEALGEALRGAGTRLVVIDPDISLFDADDWARVGMPAPDEGMLVAWEAFVAVARKTLKDAVWIESPVSVANSRDLLLCLADRVRRELHQLAEPDDSTSEGTNSR